MSKVEPAIHQVPTVEGRFHRHRIQCGDRTIACYNPASSDRRDFFQKRPSLHPVYTPSGVPVTEQGAHNFVHHKAIWLALGTVEGVNFYHDATDEGGRLITRELVWHDDPVPTLAARIEWVAPDGRVLIDERRGHRFYIEDQAHRIDVASRLTTPQEGGVALSREKHAYFHCRVLDAIDEEDGGRVRASNGIEGSEAIFNTDGFWIDCRGRVGPNSVGVMIMAHPDTGPQPLFARDYGTIALNPFMREGRHLAPDDRFDSLYSVWAYDEGDSFDCEAAFDAFARTAVTEE
jgi:hypothetical protein